MKVVIVGGVAGGATAATRLRRLDESADIVMIERDEYVSYANCGLPYYIGDVIKDKSDLEVQTVKGLSRRYKLDIRTKSEVLSINKELKTVSVKNLLTGQIYTENFDKLILSCGAKPIKPNIKGVNDAKNIFSLRNIPDTFLIKDFINSNEIKSAVIVGGGFIGVEMAENLVNLGIEVSIVEKLPQVLKNFDFEMAQIIHKELNSKGVKVILSDGIAEIKNEGSLIKLESGKEIFSDIIILAIGVTPENTLAKDAGLLLGEKGNLKITPKFNVRDVNTGAELNDIYAIGDMVEVVDFLDNTSTAVPLAWGANRQGRLVADIICGVKIKESKIQGTSVLKVFDLTVASTGANEAALRQKGVEFTAIHAHRANHASYYPDSSSICLKLLFDKKSGKIFGAQAIGKEGTEKRIDIVATAMRCNATCFDLADLELAYAPPYSSAKDPVNILGYISQNVADNMYKLVYAEQIDDIINIGGLVLDVRTKGEYSNGHISGAVNLPLDSIRENLDKIKVDLNTPIYLHCQVGIRSYIAIKILKANGFKNLYNLSGGFSTYNYFKYLSNSNEKHDNGKCL